MRTFHILLSLLFWISSGLAQSPGLASAVQSLSRCAQSCLSTSIEASPCTATNVTCICTDAPLQYNVQTCLFAKCTLRESLTAKNVTATICHAPVRDNSQSARITNIALSVISSSLGLIRIIYKAAFSLGELGWDDYTMLLMLVSGVPSVIMIDKGALPNGLGRDVWTVPFDQITNFVHWLYALEILYFFQIALLKLTLLLFFLRIFPQRTVKRLLWGTIAFVVLWAVVYVFVAIFQCQPIRHYWESWDKQHEGACININAFAWSNAAINILLDAWMLILPLYEVFQLQLTWRKKISVAMMFCVGTFVTVVSCLRLRSLVNFASSSNPTWDQTEAINWSNIEINVGIICACMPTVRVILVRIFPRIMGTTKNTTRSWGAYGDRSAYTKGGSAIASRATKDIDADRFDSHAITYVKTFEVQRTASDEVELMQAEAFRKKSMPLKSSTSSVSSF